MAINFKKFNEQFPADKMKSAMAEAKENQNNQLSDGEYTARLEKMDFSPHRRG